MKFVKIRVCFSCFESRTGYHFKAFLGQEQGQAFGVPAAHPHPKTWGVLRPPLMVSIHTCTCVALFETQGPHSHILMMGGGGVSK